MTTEQILQSFAYFDACVSVGRILPRQTDEQKRVRENILDVVSGEYHEFLCNIFEERK